MRVLQNALQNRYVFTCHMVPFLKAIFKWNLPCLRHSQEKYSYPGGPVFLIKDQAENKLFSSKNSFNANFFGANLSRTFVWEEAWLWLYVPARLLDVVDPGDHADAAAAQDGQLFGQLELDNLRVTPSSPTTSGWRPHGVHLHRFLRLRHKQTSVFVDKKRQFDSFQINFPDWSARLLFEVKLETIKKNRIR